MIFIFEFYSPAINILLISSQSLFESGLKPNHLEKTSSAGMNSVIAAETSVAAATTAVAAATEASGLDFTEF